MSDPKTPPTKLTGTPLSSAQFKGGEIITWDDRYTVEYDWDSGVAIAAYLDGLKNGKLLASYSPSSDRTVVPPRTFDELTWKEIDDLRCLPGSGRVNTFSLCYVNWDASRRDDPLIPAVIELDGASDGMGILHMLGGVDPEAVHIGMAVEAVWKAETERQGAITDILHFRPVAEPGGSGDLDAAATSSPTAGFSDVDPGATKSDTDGTQGEDS